MFRASRKLGQSLILRVANETIAKIFVDGFYEFQGETYVKLGMHLHEGVEVVKLNPAAKELFSMQNRDNEEKKLSPLEIAKSWFKD